MSKNKWIKLSTELFQNIKIKSLRKMQGGESMVLLWIFILTLPKPLSGKLQIAAGVPYQAKDLAMHAEMDEALVDKALEQMLRLRMLKERDGFYYVTGWREHQENAQKLTEYQDKQREYKKRWRDKQKESNRHKMREQEESFCPPPYIEENRQEKNRKEEKREEKDIVSTVFDRYDTLCPSLLKRGEMTLVRRKDVLELINTFGDQQITLLFEKAERSKFLRGDNARGWRAGLPWLVQSHNAAKVLDGLYDDAPSGTAMTAYERSALQEMFDD